MKIEFVQEINQSYCLMLSTAVDLQRLCLIIRSWVWTITMGGPTSHCKTKTSKQFWSRSKWCILFTGETLNFHFKLTFLVTILWCLILYFGTVNRSPDTFLTFFVVISSSCQHCDCEHVGTPILAFSSRHCFAQVQLHSAWKHWHWYYLAS